MNRRILMTYATRAGSTAEVAILIGEILRLRDFAVDVKPVKEKPTVDGYQAVIIGSAIRMGNWLPEAVEFVKNNCWQLRQIPTAFLRPICLTGMIAKPVVRPGRHTPHLYGKF